MAYQRLSINVNKELSEFVAERKKEGNTAGETVRSALHALKLILQIQAEGGTLCYENSKGQIEGILFDELFEGKQHE